MFIGSNSGAEVYRFEPCRGYSHLPAFAVDASNSGRPRSVRNVLGTLEFRAFCRLTGLESRAVDRRQFHTPFHLPFSLARWTVTSSNRSARRDLSRRTAAFWNVVKWGITLGSIGAAIVGESFRTACSLR